MTRPVRDLLPPPVGRPREPSPAAASLGRRGRLLLAAVFVLALVVIPLVLPGTQGVFTASVLNSVNSTRVMPFFTCRETLTQESGRYFASPFSSAKPVNLVNNSTMTATNVTASSAASGCRHDAQGFLTFAGSTSSPSTVAYQLPSGSTAPETYTQEMWIRTTTARGNLMAMTNNVKYASEDKQDRQLYLGSSGKLSMTNYVLATGGFEQISSPVSVTDGAWHHVVATRDAAAGRSSLYVDGKLVGSTVTAGALDKTYSPQFWRVGCARSDNWPDAPPKAGECFKGDIAYAAAYSRAFTSQDVMNHYRAGTW